MKEKGLKQVDVVSLCKPFCKKYGVKLNKSHMSQYVSGKVVPSQYKLSVLGMALGVSETWLMGYDVPKEREEGFIRTDAQYLTEDEQKLLDGYRRAPQEIRDAVNAVLAPYLEKSEKSARSAG